MPSSNFTYDQPANKPSHVVKEEQIEYGFIGKLQGLKYEYRADIRDRAALERNFREKFESLNRVKLSDGEFARLLDEIVTPDVFTAARTLRNINAFMREDGTPLQRPKAQWEAAGEQAAEQVEDPVTDPVARPLATLTARPFVPSEIQQRLELKRRPTFRAKYLRPALERLWVEPTLPDKPNSRLQQYRLTEQGGGLLK